MASNHPSVLMLVAWALLGCSVCTREAPNGGKPPPERRDREPRPLAPPVQTQQNGQVQIRHVARSPVLNDGPAVEIVVTSSRAFPAMGSMPVLRIGARSFLVSRYQAGDLHTLIFTLAPQQFDAVQEGELVTVQYGQDEHAADPDLVWSFGPLRKLD